MHFIVDTVDEVIHVHVTDKTCTIIHNIKISTYTAKIKRLK